MSNQARYVFNKMFKEDHCSQWMGIEPVLIDDGHCILKMKVKKDMLNGFGILHGGIAYAFADSAFAFAANSYGRMSVSINGSMNYSKSAHLGDKLEAEAKVISLNNKTADFDVEIKNVNTDDKLYFFRGTVFRTTKDLLETGV